VAKAAMLQWLGMLYFLLPYEHTGPFVLMLVEILYATRYFFVLLAIAVAAATHGFYVLFPRSQPEFETLWHAVYSSANMVLFGQYDAAVFDEQPEALGNVAKLVNFVLQIVVTVLLLNLLIAILSDAYERVKERKAIELTHVRIKIITDQQFSLVGYAVMLVQLLALLVVTVWVWLPLLVLALSSCCCGCCKPAVDRFYGAIAWVLGLDTDGSDTILKWYLHHCWLVWFYRGGDTILTVVMPHDADIELEQERSEWQKQEEGTPGMLSDINESNDAIWKKSGELEAKMDDIKLAVAESNDAMKLAVAESNNAMEKKVTLLEAKVDGLDTKMDQVLHQLRVLLTMAHE